MLVRVALLRRGDVRLFCFEEKVGIRLLGKTVFGGFAFVDAPLELMIRQIHFVERLLQQIGIIQSDPILRYLPGAEMQFARDCVIPFEPDRPEP